MKLFIFHPVLYYMQVNRNLDEWPKTVAHVPDALRRYYVAFLASTKEAVQVSDLLIPFCGFSDSVREQVSIKY